MTQELKEIETENNTVKTYSYKGYKIEIFQDENPENPIQNWDMLGKYICWHKRYDLGNCTDFENPEEVKVYAKKHNALLYPLYMYEHSGIGLSLTNDRYPYNCPWDAGQLGYIMVERNAALALLPNNTVKEAEKLEEKVLEILNGEVETYNQYLSGDVYGYVVSKEGEHIDSCWGIYDIDEALSQAKNCVE